MFNKKNKYTGNVLIFFLVFSFVYLLQMVFFSNSNIDVIMFIGITLLMFYYNVDIYIDEKELEIKNNMFKFGSIFAIFQEIFLKLTDYNSYSGFMTDLIDFYKIYDFYFIISAIFLFLVNKKFKMKFINSCIETFIMCFIFYFIVSIVLFMIEPLKNSSISSLIKEITNSKINIIEYELSFDINIAVSQLTIFFMMSYILILLMKPQRTYYMTYNKYISRLFIAQWKYIKKSFNNPIRRQKTYKKFLDEFNRQKEEHFKHYIKEEKKSIDNESNKIRFKIFKFINNELYCFLQENKKYLLFYAFYFEILNGFFVYFFDYLNFENYFNEQIYFLFILLCMMCVFNQDDFLKKIKENKDSIIINILIISAIFIIQENLYNLTKIYIFNTFIIVLLYSMRDNFIANNIFKLELYIIFIVYTFYSIIGFCVIDNNSYKESLIFFYSIIFFIFVNKEIVNTLKIRMCNFFKI